MNCEAILGEGYHTAPHHQQKTSHSSERPVSNVISVRDCGGFHGEHFSGCGPSIIWCNSSGHPPDSDGHPVCSFIGWEVLTPFITDKQDQRPINSAASANWMNQPVSFMYTFNTNHNHYCQWGYGPAPMAEWSQSLSPSLLTMGLRVCPDG